MILVTDYRATFPQDAFVRDLGAVEIASRGLTHKYWAEFLEAFIAYSEIVGKIIVPKGFLSDGASIPRFLWLWLDGTDPDILFASYCHDLLYTLQQFTKDQCDRTIRELMIKSGAPRWKANAVYAGLRLGGAKAWNEATLNLTKTQSAYGHN